MNQLWPAEFGLANVRTIIYHVLLALAPSPLAHLMDHLI